MADLICRSSQLRGITVPASRAASMIDEYPILAVAAAYASGETHMPGIEELRVKETDRIALMEDSLKRGGVDITSTHDSMTVIGATEHKGGMAVDAQHDHRIAMSFSIAALRATGEIKINDCANVDTSFPTFVELATEVGMTIHKGNV
ncbi:MAG: 3-phosphoshikimate 1-carboxyvinyltransferase [Pontibacterium sp.]